MNKTLKTLFITSLCGYYITTAYASGIPTVDAAGIATTISENLKTLTQLKAELDAINHQIEQAKNFAEDTKRRFEGNWNIADLANNDQFLSVLPREAKDVLLGGGNFNPSLRQQYGLVTDNTAAQKSFDTLIKYAERTKQAYKNTLNRINKLKEIQRLANAASTPAEKADVANKLALEKLSFDQEQQALKQMEESVKIQAQLEADRQKHEFSLKLKEAREAYKRHNNY